MVLSSQINHSQYLGSPNNEDWSSRANSLQFQEISVSLPFFLGINCNHSEDVPGYHLPNPGPVVTPDNPKRPAGT
jgi:hypothetical protein